MSHGGRLDRSVWVSLVLLVGAGLLLYFTNDLLHGVLLRERAGGVANAANITALNELRYWLWGLAAVLVLLAGYLMFQCLILTRLRGEVSEARQLGQYTLRRKIGEGGMGKVYLARHALLRRPTAVKVLRREFSRGDSLRRFQREVAYTSRLSHPNTIAIYDYGHTPDGRFYYAMEYLQGVTLSRCIQDTGPQPPARVVYIMQQVCGAIAEAHGAGLIHRDIKPGNIMLCERGGVFDFAKVLDFGLVRKQVAADTHGISSIQTLTGTPLYLAPESIRDPERVDRRSDVYQLGLLGYYMLTGSHLFAGNNIYEVCAQHLDSPPEPPSQRLGRAVPAALEGLLLQCLEKDMDARPADALALLYRFERLAAGDLAGLWGQQEARNWWQIWLQEHEDFHTEEEMTGTSLSVTAPATFTGEGLVDDGD